MNTCSDFPDRPQMILITGIMAAGKSTVAQQVAERLTRSVHLRGDAFRRAVVNGREEMGTTLSEEALAQLWLRYRVAAAAAQHYLQAGFTVVYQDIIIGPALSEVIQFYRQYPLHVVVLCPTPEVVAAREAGRAKKGYSDPAAVTDFDLVLSTETPRIGLWLDNSTLSVDETVNYILAHLSQARVYPEELLT